MFCRDFVFELFQTDGGADDHVAGDAPLPRVSTVRFGKSQCSNLDPSRLFENNAQ